MPVKLNYQIKATLRALQLVLYFAWGDTRARYSRSVLGPFWLVIGTAVGVAGLGFIWGGLLNIDRASFVPALAIGIVVWQLIAGCITESSSAFTRNSAVIRNLNTPFLIFPAQLLLRQLINFLHNVVVVVLVFFIYPPPFSISSLLVIPGLILVIGNLGWVVILFGMLGARFRDLEQTVAVLVPLLFFLSPVLYRPKQLGDLEFYIWLNPLSYLISVVRDPIQGFTPAGFVYLVSGGMLVIGWIVAIWLYRNRSIRIPFWV